MDQAGILETFAEVGIAMTGFTGIVVVLGRRSGGEWSPVELAQLHDLLWLSLHVVVFAFLPLVLVQTLAPAAAWQASAGAFAGMEVLFLSRYVWRGIGFYRAGTEMPAWGVRAAFLGAPLGLGLLAGRIGVAFGFWSEHAAVLYLGGLLFALLAAVINFIFLLLRPSVGGPAR